MVVGGAGFIGSHLVDRLLAEQHVVDVVDDLSTGSLANLADARALGSELKIHHLDAGAEEFVSLVAMREPEVIYHLGWSPPGRSGPQVLARSIQSTINLLEAARVHGIAKVVTTLPAGALYGEVPVRELPVKEARPWAPVGAGVEMVDLKFGTERAGIGKVGERTGGQIVDHVDNMLLGE